MIVQRITAQPAPRIAGILSDLGAYVALTKPRIIALLLVTALGGLFLAAEGAPTAGLTIVVLLGGALTSGGANAINHYLDRDIDARMARTRLRPLPAQRLRPVHALAFGIALNVAGFAILAAGANVLSAVLAVTASLFYVLVYTSWLKRTTPQNIVIGGAAGAMPPVVAWAAVTGSLSWPALCLFLIIWLWTPPHFWALALLLREDYEQARIPMLPVVAGQKHTIRSIVAYSAALVAITLAAGAASSLGILYWVSAALLGGLFVWLASRLLIDADRQRLLTVYLYSILYLFVLFGAIIADAIVQT